MKKNLLPLIFIIIIASIAPVIISAESMATKCILTEDVKSLGLDCVDAKGTSIPQGTVPETYIDADGECLFSDSDNDCVMCCTINTVLKATNFIFLGAIVVATAAGIFGGFSILTAGGNADQVNKGKDSIKYSIIGLAVALLANAIPALITNVLGLG